VRCAWRNRGRFIGNAHCETLLRPRRPGASEQRSVDRESPDRIASLMPFPSWSIVAPQSTEPVTQIDL
jgi:hypothetical protein